MGMNYMAGHGIWNNWKNNYDDVMGDDVILKIYKMRRI